MWMAAGTCTEMKRVWPHPLPASPIKGEVPFGEPGKIVPHAQFHTSPLMGEDGRGWSQANQPMLVPHNVSYTRH